MQNNLIRPSFSSHRSSNFFARNHNEEKQGKTRLVINYKRLNDITYDDAYKIPNKNSLINFTQGCKYFLQLDYKSGFWQIRLDKDSEPWTIFSCPCGLYEWNVMAFGLKKKLYKYFNEWWIIFLEIFFCSCIFNNIIIFFTDFSRTYKKFRIYFWRTN